MRIVAGVHDNAEQTEGTPNDTKTHTHARAKGKIMHTLTRIGTEDEKEAFS